METDFGIIQPHREAAELIKGKPVVSREVFDGMLPELRGRAFTITGVEGATVMQRVRDAIAGLPQGGPDGTWDKVKEQVVQELDPFLGDGAERRAELLMRTHGFQAFEASTWRVAQEDDDTTHLQYLATEDDRVRSTHLALNGIVLPKDDPFWQTHTPPWEWGCRCRIRAMNPDMVDETRQADEKKAPENRNVIEGPALDQLRNGTLMRDGQRYDVTPPAQKGGPGSGTAYQWNPDDLRLPVEDLKARYEPEVWGEFESWAKHTIMGQGQGSVWRWMNAPGAPAGAPSRGAPAGAGPGASRAGAKAEARRQWVAEVDPTGIAAELRGKTIQQVYDELLRMFPNWKVVQVGTVVTLRKEPGGPEILRVRAI